MKNWLIEKLGGVSKKEHEAVIVTTEIFRSMLKDYMQRISDGLKEKSRNESRKSRNGKGGGNGQREPVGNNQPSE